MEVLSEACQNWCTHQANDDTVVGGDESTSYMLTSSNAAHDKEDGDSGHNDGDDEEIDPATVQVVIARFNDTHAARRRHDLIHRFEQKDQTGEIDTPSGMVGVQGECFGVTVYVSQSKTRLKHV